VARTCKDDLEDVSAGLLPHSMRTGPRHNGRHTDSSRTRFRSSRAATARSELVATQVPAQQTIQTATGWGIPGPQFLAGQQGAGVVTALQPIPPREAQIAGSAVGAPVESVSLMD
jgi:hypothetical protein